jgi:hypothetical protein
MVTPSGLLVLDLDELTLRCRLCDWVSPAIATVERAAQSFATHACAPQGDRIRGCRAGPIGTCGGVEGAEMAARRPRSRSVNSQPRTGR